MEVSTRILKQLGHPSGLTGRLILRLLNRVNMVLNDIALNALDLGDSDHVLEIGFGGGSLIDSILSYNQTTRVTGAEISELAIKVARYKFRKNPRVDFALSEGNTLPFETAEFTHAVSVNVIYFWPDVPEMLSEVHRILTNGGKFVLCYSDQSPDNVTRFFHEDVEAQLHTAGFSAIHSTESFDKDNDSYFCTVAIKS